MARHNYEIEQGVRFEFGKNWENLLKYLDDERIDLAMVSLCDTLEINNLNGRSFLDIGCGSGLFSLAAKMLGASVHSFDFDPASVACTRELKRALLSDRLRPDY
jgi:2-polyprenyl-6-hydroxyphenyl methylase/3-demethylubiquinone-9 3-methyltransferase